MKKKIKHKKKEKQIKIKDILSSEIFLAVVFFILIIVVSILVIIVLHKKEELEKNPPANIVIPIYKDFTSYHFSISAEALSEKNIYVLKITNYKEDEINSNDIKYQVTISNDTTSKLEVTKENELKDFMTNQKKQIINGKFSKDEKQEDVYHIKMISHKKIKDDDFIRVLIENKETEQ